MFGSRNGGETKGYSGSESYKYVEKLIKGRGGAVRIVTPYISQDYARMLIRASRWKTVYLLLSANGSGNNEEAMSLLKRGSRRFGVELSVSLLLLMAASFMLGLYILILPMLFVFFTALVLTITRKSGHPNLRVKTVTSKFIHEKLYIGDDTAIAGSANLTYSGMHRNVEHLEIISDRKRIDEMKDHFDQMWAKY